MFDRRGFLRNSAVVSLAPIMPTFLARLAQAEIHAGDQDRMLVVIQMDGGNDGINTVVPIQDEGYAKHRRELRLPEAELLKVSSEFALHPRLRSISQLFEQSRLSIVHGVGYPNPNRSHFESMKIWHAGSNDQELLQSNNGWIGDAFGSKPVQLGSPHAIHVGDETLPVAVRGRRCLASQVSSLAELQLRLTPRQLSEASRVDESNSLDAFVTRSASQAYATAEQISSVASSDPSVSYPDSKLGQKLKLIGQLMKSKIGARVYYALQSGYDTHAGQLPTHGDLLGNLSSSLKAFMDDLRQSGLEDQVLVLCFSEFGRRVEENDSIGTDHGTAGPVFLAGTRLANRTFGTQPSLSDLDDGDLKFGIDFRRIYAAIVADWLQLKLPPSLAGFQFDGLFQA